MLAFWMEINNRAFRDFSKPSYRVYRRAMEKVILSDTRYKGCEDMGIGIPAGDWDSIIGLDL